MHTFRQPGVRLGRVDGCCVAASAGDGRRGGGVQSQLKSALLVFAGVNSIGLAGCQMQGLNR